MSRTIEEEWGKGVGTLVDQPRAEIPKLRDILDSLVKSEVDEWDEVIFEETGGTTTVVRRTSSSEYLVELSISTREYLEEFSTLKGPATEISIEDVKGVLTRMDGPAMTAEELAQELKCSIKLVQSHLEELYMRGRAEKRESGSTTLWWAADGEQDLLRGYGAFADSDVPSMMQEERERLRDEWKHDQTLSG